nr:hypothetical protein [Tanacetum cinerariifolium]
MSFKVKVGDDSYSDAFFTSSTTYNITTYLPFTNRTTSTNLTTTKVSFNFHENFCDTDLEVAFRKSTCFVRDLQGNDLLTSNHGSDLYTMSLQESTSSTPLCLMAKATPTQAWLWHRRVSHLNFNYINLLSKKDIVIGLPKLKYVKDQLCSSCELSKSKRISFKSKAVLSSKGRLNLLHMDVCGPMRVTSINGKKYIMVIVDDYSRYMITVRTERGTEFLNKTLNAFFKEEGIEHQTSTARTPKQNGVVERRNRTLVEAARTMLLASQLPLFFWGEAIATARYSQNRSIIIPTHGKTPYHIINDRKPSIKHLYSFSCTCYITRDGKNIDKIKEKGISAFWPVQTRQQLAIDPEMCMYALTVSTAEPKNIKEAMADSAWIEAMHEELHQFDRLHGSSFELTAFSDADHARCIDSRKITSEGIQFLGDKLVSWMSKKQNCTAMSPAEAEYVALSASCAQVMWMRTQL